MSYQAAVFDLDGTLVDSLQDLAETGNQVLNMYGYPLHPVDAYRYFVGDGLSTLIKRILPLSRPETEHEEHIRSFSEIYARSWRRNSCPYPGIHAMLAGLKEAGLRLAVLSNKPHVFTREFVAYFFPEGTFEVVFGQRPEIGKKPDPAGALEIAGLMAVRPDECLYIGDTAVDMQTGKSAGMFTIGVLWGFRDQDELQEHRADMIVHHPMEIVEYAVASLRV
jgi:phosphoglycolate phosphatase